LQVLRHRMVQFRNKATGCTLPETREFFTDIMVKVLVKVSGTLRIS